MAGPVFAVDGHIYERSLIEKWLRDHKNSPKTGEELASTALIPCHSMRSLIDYWRSKQA